MLRLSNPGRYPIVYGPDELVFKDQLLRVLARNQRIKFVYRSSSHVRIGGLIFLEFNPNHVLFGCASITRFVRDRFSPPNVPKLGLSSADLSIRTGRFVRVIAKCDGNATSTLRLTEGN